MKRFGLYYKCQHLQIVSTVNFPKPIYLASHFIFTLKIIYKQSTLVDTATSYADQWYQQPHERAA